MTRDLKQSKKLFDLALEGGLSVANQNLGILKQKGSGYTLISTKIDSEIRASVLTEEPLDLAHWLEVDRVPKLGL